MPKFGTNQFNRQSDLDFLEQLIRLASQLPIQPASVFGMTFTRTTPLALARRPTKESENNNTFEQTVSEPSLESVKQRAHGERPLGTTPKTHKARSGYTTWSGEAAPHITKLRKELWRNFSILESLKKELRPDDIYETIAVARNHIYPILPVISNILGGRPLDKLDISDLDIFQKFFTSARFLNADTQHQLEFRREPERIPIKWEAIYRHEIDILWWVYGAHYNYWRSTMLDDLMDLKRRLQHKLQLPVCQVTKDNIIILYHLDSRFEAIVEATIKNPRTCKEIIDWCQRHKQLVLSDSATRRDLALLVKIGALKKNKPAGYLAVGDRVRTGT